MVLAALVMATAALAANDRIIFSVEALLFAGGLLFSVLGVAIWLPDRRTPGSKAAIGSALVSGAIVAFAVLAIQVRLDREAEVREVQRAAVQDRLDEVERAQSDALLDLQVQAAELERRALTQDRISLDLTQSVAAQQGDLIAALEELRQAISDLP